jgi:hypothetical protein
MIWIRSAKDENTKNKTPHMFSSVRREEIWRKWKTKSRCENVAVEERQGGSWCTRHQKDCCVGSNCSAALPVPEFCERDVDEVSISVDPSLSWSAKMVGCCEDAALTRLLVAEVTTIASSDVVTDDSGAGVESSSGDGADASL